jgi:hypothetical protein
METTRNCVLKKNRVLKINPDFMKAAIKTFKAPWGETLTPAKRLLARILL